MLQLEGLMNSSNSLFGLKIGHFGQYPLNTLSAARRALFQSERVRSNRPKTSFIQFRFFFLPILNKSFEFRTRKFSTENLTLAEWLRRLT